MEGRQSVRRLAGATAVVLALGATIAVVAGGAAAHRSATTLTIWCWTGADGPLKSVDDGFAKAHPDIQTRNPMSLSRPRKAAKPATTTPSGTATRMSFLKNARKAESATGKST